MKCENCGSDCERDSVDVGVGVIHGPYGCYACGWSEDPEYDGSKGETEAERKHPDWISDPCGGLTRKDAIRDKLEHFGLPRDLL